MAQMGGRRPWLKRVWLLLTDHSVGGVWGTKREAIAAMRLRQGDHSLAHTEFYVAGPYVLENRGAR